MAVAGHRPDSDDFEDDDHSARGGDDDSGFGLSSNFVWAMGKDD